MSPSAILSEASRRGIKLAVLGDGLTVNAPKGSIDPEFRLRLTEAKSDLLRLLTIEPTATPGWNLSPDFPIHRIRRLLRLEQVGLAEGLPVDEVRRLAIQAVFSEIACDNPEPEPVPEPDTRDVFRPGIDTWHLTDWRFKP